MAAFVDECSVAPVGRFKASRRRNRDLVEPVIRASSDSCGYSIILLSSKLIFELARGLSRRRELAETR
jgi:hypothetical protein